MKPCLDFLWGPLRARRCLSRGGEHQEAGIVLPAVHVYVLGRGDGTGRLSVFCWKKSGGLLGNSLSVTCPSDFWHGTRYTRFNISIGRLGKGRTVSAADAMKRVRKEISEMPADMLQQVLDFIRFLKSDEDEESFLWAQVEETLAQRTQSPETVKTVSAEEWLADTETIEDDT